MLQTDNNGPDGLNTDLLDPDFLRAVQSAWCRETCWPGCVDGYPENRDNNPSYGNCLVTVLAAWASRNFQDDIVPGFTNDNAWHFRLGVYPDSDDPRCDQHGTVQVDPTWQQFEEGSIFDEPDCKTPHGRTIYRVILIGSLWEDDSLARRLQLLIDRMHNEGGFIIGYNAREIVEAAKQDYEFVTLESFVSNFLSIPPAPQM